MKRLLAICLCLTLLLGGCMSAPEPSDSESELSVVTTMAPYYDWACELTRGVANAAPKLLLSSSGDLHSYQPTLHDLQLIASCDLLIYGGGASEAWVAQALENREGSAALCLADTIEDRWLCDDDHDETAHAHDGHCTFDEHIWLSLKNAEVLVNAMAEALCEQLSDQTDAVETIRANAASYAEKLEALDRRYTETLDAADDKTLVFADRYPYRYLAADYGLDVVAAFSGCSAESEASFATIVHLAQVVDAHQLSAVLVLKDSGMNIAESVIEGTAARTAVTLTLDPMQTGVCEDSYLAVMSHTLEVIAQALGL